MRSLSQRLVVVVAASVAVGFAVTAFLVWRIVTDAVARDFDARLSTALAELSAAADLGTDGILLLARNPGNATFGQPRSGWYWSLARGETTVARSRSLVLSDLPRPRDAEFSPQTGVGPEGESLRVLYRRIAVRDGAETLLATAAGPARLIGDEIWSSMRPVLAAMAIAAAIIVVLIGLEIQQGLKPLRSLADDVERAAHGKIDRIPQSGYRELAPLSQGINGLIDQVETTVARARAEASNLAHAIKTSLSLISARNESLGAAGDADVALSVETISRQIDHHLARARFAAKAGLASEPVPVRPVIDDIALVMERSYRARNVSLAVSVGDDLSFLGEREDLEEMLGNLVENACKWARRSVRITGQRSADRIQIAVDDDGPGVPASMRQHIRKRGQRLDESVSGSGLGLAIVDELVGLYGGTLILDESPDGGLRAEIFLPGLRTQVA